MTWRAVALVLSGLGSVNCGKSTAPSASMPSASTREGGADAPVATPSAEDSGPSPMDAREAAAWAVAVAKDLARLADLVGCQGLRDRADQTELRGTAIRAMEYCGDFSELPWLAQVGTAGNDDEARAALDVVVELSAMPRRATDPEDADELHVGCGALLDLARGVARPKERRVLAIRALRMLSERGCVKLRDIPRELDAP